MISWHLLLWYACVITWATHRMNIKLLHTDSILDSIQSFNPNMIWDLIRLESCDSCIHLYAYARLVMAWWEIFNKYFGDQSLLTPHVTVLIHSFFMIYLYFICFNLYMKGSSFCFHSIKESWPLKVIGLWKLAPPCSRLLIGQCSECRHWGHFGTSFDLVCKEWSWLLISHNALGWT